MKNSYDYLNGIPLSYTLYVNHATKDEKPVQLLLHAVKKHIPNTCR